MTVTRKPLDQLQNAFFGKISRSEWVNPYIYIKKWFPRAIKRREGQRGGYATRPHKETSAQETASPQSQILFLFRRPKPYPCVEFKKNWTDSSFVHFKGSQNSFRPVVRNQGRSTRLVHGPGPRRGPWTRSTEVVHGQGSIFCIRPTYTPYSCNNFLPLTLKSLILF